MTASPSPSLTPSDGPSLLSRYFSLLDARRVDELLAMFAPQGMMITKGGTEGRAVVGTEALRAFYAARGPATATHVVTTEAAGAGAAFAEGLVKFHDGARPKYFIASATTDAEGLILRYTTLVWDALEDDQVSALVGPSYVQTA